MFILTTRSSTGTGPSKVCFYCSRNVLGFVGCSICGSESAKALAPISCSKVSASPWPWWWCSSMNSLSTALNSDLFFFQHPFRNCMLWMSSIRWLKCGKNVEIWVIYENSYKETLGTFCPCSSSIDHQLHHKLSEAIKDLPQQIRTVASLTR